MSVEMHAQLPGYGPPTPVPIFQWEKEFEAVLGLYDRIIPQSVLEIGTYHGGTLYHWLTRGAAGLVVSVDSYAVGVDNRHLYGEWVREGVTLEVIQGDSRDPAIIESVRGMDFCYDWIFIDAGHYYHEVKADWDNYLPMASQDAVVLFHDILPPTQAHPEIEVAQLWQEIKAEYLTLEVVADPFAEWGGIGIVLL